MDSYSSLITLTPDVVVEQLLLRMGNNAERYGIHWYNFDSYYTAIVDDVRIKCFASAPSLRGYASNICLIIFHNGKTRTIEQPSIHISKTPLGKFLRFVTGLSKALTSLFGIGPYPKELHPREPHTPKDREDERLRAGLDKLYSKIERQLEYRANERYLKADRGKK